MEDKETRVSEHSLGPHRFGDVNQLFEDLSKSSMVGIAICDSELRYLRINNTLASFNGIPPEAHIGKTVPEIVGRAALTLEPVMKSVLATGESVRNVEVVSKLPARAEQGHWVVDFLPVKDCNGQAVQIVALVIEITRQKRFEQCLFAMMRNLPRIRDQVRCVGLPDRTEIDRIESLVGSAELLEQCIQEIRRISTLLPPSTASSKQTVLGAEQVNIQLSDTTELHGMVPPEQHLERDLVENGESLLTPREMETLRLLANGKSNKEIAVALGIAVRTVETYRARIMMKLSLHSMSALVKYAVRYKLVEV